MYPVVIDCSAVLIHGWNIVNVSAKASGRVAPVKYSLDCMSDKHFQEDGP